MKYVELQVTTHFSFLRGASSADELFATAAALGIDALGVVDRNSLAGIVRAWEASKATGVRLVVGCRLDLIDGMSILIYPSDRPAYSRLTRLLSLGKARGGKGNCLIDFADLAEHAAGMIGVMVPDEPDEACAVQLRKMAELFGDRAYVSLCLRRRPNDRLRLHGIATMAAHHRVRTIVTNDVLFHEPGRRQLQDVVTCIRTRTTIDDVGFDRERHADRFLKPPEEMHRLFSEYPEALTRTREILARCTFDLKELQYQYPEEAIVPGLDPQQSLVKFVWEGALVRYPEGVPDKVRRSLQDELELIRVMNYAPYFLTVFSIVRFARSKDILCQGRGSAANSAVCYCLGVTSIDPDTNDLLFERFISQERDEPPDIDVDFEHERREEVIQWIYETYGRSRAALCSTVTRYRAKGALRDVGKALGLPEDMIGQLSSGVWGWSEGVTERQIRENNLNAADYRLKLTLELAHQLMGAPRHLGQHPGGFVLTHDRLDDLVPIEPARMDDRQVIEWDKDDIEALKFMKVDVLALGMLTCMAKAFALMAEHKGDVRDLASIPAEDPRTYAMIRKADTLGTFQIESRAQMSMLPRLKPRTFYDLVIQVAIVRPGPIQGDMVHPYLRRREGKEPEEYPREELRRILGRTKGVPLFQEQVMQIAIEIGGFSASEADQLRRSMATFRRTGRVAMYKERMVRAMVKKGYPEEFALRCFKQIEGFGEYGFPESHAASFALLVYASAWFKAFYPDVFCAAILNSQPMGFYGPGQLVRDAREHGIEVRTVDVNLSQWDATLEESPFDPARIAPKHREMKDVIRSSHAVRLGLRQVKGLAEADMLRLIEQRGSGYTSVRDLWLRTNLSPSVIERLAEADAFRSMGLDRRAALWAARALDRKQAAEGLPLFDRPEVRLPDREPKTKLPVMPLSEHVIRDYRAQSFSLKAHPLAFLRAELAREDIVPNGELDKVRNGRRITVAGVVLIRQRPGSAKGVIFMTIEDETGTANIIVWPKVFETFRPIVLGARLVRVTGKLQSASGVIHVVADRIEDISWRLEKLSEAGQQVDFRSPVDETKRPVVEDRRSRHPSVAMPKGRNFH